MNEVVHIHIGQIQMYEVLVFVYTSRPRDQNGLMRPDVGVIQVTEVLI